MSFVGSFTYYTVVAGTMRQAEFKPDLPQSVFLAFKAEEEDDGKIGRPTMNISRRRSGDFPKVANQKPKDTVDYFDDILDDGDFIAAGTLTRGYI